MATKKEEPVIKEEPIIFEPEKWVTIRSPRDRSDDEDVVVWVNEKRYLIQRGVAVSVPSSVAEVLENQERMLTYIYNYEDRVQK